MPVTRSQDLVVAAGTVLTYTESNDGSFDAGIIFVQGGAPDYHQPSLINYGELEFQALTNGSGIFLDFDNGSYWDKAELQNYGIIDASRSTSFYIEAIYAGEWSPDLFNAGSILAKAVQQASCYYTYDSSLTITNTATGIMSASSGYDAFTIYLGNGGTIINAGQIIATDTGNTPDVAVAIASPISGHLSVMNSGLIEATGTPYYSYGIDFYANVGDPALIVNSGTIEAKVAIQEYNPYDYNGRSEIENSGHIYGQIILAAGNDILHNTGAIVGNVDLGADDDVYDGALGSISGLVLGGDGNDLLIGGAGQDTFDGGSGDDVLFGGAGDTLTGGDGADTFISTTVTPGAAAETITDFVSGTDHIDLRPLAPTSVSISGSTVTAVTASGTLTIDVNGAIAAGDILTGPTTALTGTDVEDALAAGPAGAVLDGGAAVDLLVGESGNDTLIGGSGDNDDNGNLMWGGTGDDTYVVSMSTDVIVENPNAGYDTIEIVPGAFDMYDSNFTLPANVERLIGGSGVGNSLDNVMIGTSDADSILGMDGNDSLSGLGGADLLTGGSGADTLTGGDGADTFQDTAAGLNGDTITDFHGADKIVITDATLGGFTFSVSGNVLTYTGGSITFESPIARPLTVAADPNGGVMLTLLRMPAHNEFTGDAYSDMLLRDSTGNWVTEWIGSITGGLGHYDPSDPYAGAGIGTNSGFNWTQYFGPDWHIAGTGDFNGDGRSDFMLQSDGGWVTDWLSSSSGGFTNNGANASLYFASNWQIAGTGDFNGDGISDFLLHDTSGGGWLTEWLGNSSGGFTNNGANSTEYFASDWKVIGTGDFNGDGTDDFLLQNTAGWVTDWLGTSTGGFTNNGAHASLYFTSDWHVIGTGDFNGDGISDILLRSDAGWVTDWLGNSSGGFTNNGANASVLFSSDWKIASVGDFNGDGNDDLLLRNDNGWTTDWLGTASGGFTNNGAHFSTYIAPEWHVQDPFM